MEAAFKASVADLESSSVALDSHESKWGPRRHLREPKLGQRLDLEKKKEECAVSRDEKSLVRADAVWRHSLLLDASGARMKGRVKCGIIPAKDTVLISAEHPDSSMLLPESGVEA